MKLEQIDLYELDVPPIPPIAKYSPELFHLTLCRIYTAEGLIGLGETYGAPTLFAERVASLTGQDPLALDALAQCAKRPTRCGSHGFSSSGDHSRSSSRLQHLRCRA